MIWITLPTKRIAKVFDTHRLLRTKEYIYYRRKLIEIDEAIIKLQHARSVVERLVQRNETH